MDDGRINRRTFFATTAAAAVAAATQSAAQEKTQFRNRGIVITPTDVPGMGWPVRCAKAGIHTIALHEFHAWPLLRFVLDREGQSFLAELRKDDPAAQLAHLAYHSTLPAPTQVKPAPGVFLEFAPIDRAYAGHLGKPFVRLSQRDNRPRPKDYSNGELLDFLDANLTVFPAATAQALEYWLDVSVLSVGSPTPRLLQLDPAVLDDDLAEYSRRGLRSITTFAVQMNSIYLQHHPDPQPLLLVFHSSPPFIRRTSPPLFHPIVPSHSKQGCRSATCRSATGWRRGWVSSSRA